MTTYNTRNPIGSTAAKDVYDNAENLDRAVNDRTSGEWVDRLGKTRKTWRGMEQDFSNAQAVRTDEFQQFLLNSGYQDLGDYQAGLVITARNQVFRKDAELYRAAAATGLPYTTTGTWADESSAFVNVGDAALRQEIANHGLTFDSSTPVSRAGHFPRIIKYAAGPVSTRALGITAGSTSVSTLTSRLKSALFDGVDVYVEPSEAAYQLDDTLASGREGQIICGSGVWSQLQMVVDFSNVISVTHDRCHVHDVAIQPSAARNSTLNGIGIYVVGCDKPIIERIAVSGGRSGGIAFYNVNGGTIRCTRHTASVVDPDVDDSTQSGCDIALYASCNDCLIDDIISQSGIGTTVAIQTAIVDAAASARNIIRNVRILNQHAYGIILYVSDKDIQSVVDTIIDGVMIAGVTGKIINAVTNNHSFGAGIYVQGAEHSTIMNANLSDTNINTDNETLAPGAIGVVNSSSIRINCVRIENAHRYGIMLADPNALGVSGGHADVSDVLISGSTKSGIRQVDFNDVRIRDSNIVGNGTSGIEAMKISNAAMRTSVRRVVASNNAQHGISVGSGVAGVAVEQCVLQNNGLTGVTSAAQDSNIDGINASSNALQGIRLTNASGIGSVSRSRSVGNGTGLEVAVGSSVSVNSTTNDISGNTAADFAGQLHPVSGFITLANVATPTLSGNSTFYKTGGTTAITGFTGGATVGHEITIFVQHTVTILGRASVNGDVVKCFLVGSGIGWKIVV